MALENQSRYSDEFGAGYDAVFGGQQRAPAPARKKKRAKPLTAQERKALARRLKRRKTAQPVEAGIHTTRLFRPAERPCSEGASVHPSQIAKAEEIAARCGVPTKFDSHGRPLFDSWSHKDRYLRTQGMHVDR